MSPQRTRRNSTWMSIGIRLVLSMCGARTFNKLDTDVDELRYCNSFNWCPVQDDVVAPQRFPPKYDTSTTVPPRQVRSLRSMEGGPIHRSMRPFTVTASLGESC